MNILLSVIFAIAFAGSTDNPLNPHRNMPPLTEKESKCLAIATIGKDSVINARKGVPMINLLSTLHPNENDLDLRLASVIVVAYANKDVLDPFDFEQRLLAKCLSSDVKL